LSDTKTTKEQAQPEHEVSERWLL